MAVNDLVLLKLGGSVITFKDKPLTFNPTATAAICRTLSSIGRPVAIVHGGGSFGHHYAEKHHLSRRISQTPAIGIAETKTAMMELHLLVLRHLQDAGLAPFTLPPVTLLHDDFARLYAGKLLATLLGVGLVPVTYGDVIPRRRGYCIVSGDTLMFELARILRPSKVLFTMDQDGVFKDRPGIGMPLKVVGAGGREFERFLKGLEAGAKDRTGGIGFKLREAGRIARLGIDVFFVNGLKPERIVKVLNRGEFQGTLIKKRL